MKNRTRYPNAMYGPQDCSRGYHLADDTEFVDVTGPAWHHGLRDDGQKCKVGDVTESVAGQPDLAYGETQRFFGPAMVLVSDLPDDAIEGAGKTLYTSEDLPEDMGGDRAVVRDHGRLLTHVEMLRRDVVKNLTETLRGPVGALMREMDPTRMQAMALSANQLAQSLPWSDEGKAEMTANECLAEMLTEARSRCHTPEAVEAQRLKDVKLIESLIEGTSKHFDEMKECVPEFCKGAFFGYYEGDPEAEKLEADLYSVREMRTHPLLQNPDLN